MSQMEIDRVLATIRSFSKQGAGGVAGSAALVSRRAASGPADPAPRNSQTC